MNPQHSTSHQLQLDFTPGLTERHESVLDCVRASVYTQAKPLKTIAMDMDMSPSDLSRKLSSNPDDPRRFTVHDLERYVESTGDTTPILYLAQKYCISSEVKQREAIAALAALAPQLSALLRASGVTQ